MRPSDKSKLHPTNQLRLLAGLTIDPILEKQHAQKLKEADTDWIGDRAREEMAKMPKKRVSVEKDTNHLLRNSGAIFYLVMEATRQSGPGDIIVKCTGESFAYMFIGAGGHHQTGGGGTFAKDWLLYNEIEKEHAIKEANRRLQSVGNHNTIITEQMLDEMDDEYPSDSNFLLVKAFDNVITYLKTQIARNANNEDLLRTYSDDLNEYKSMLEDIKLGKVDWAARTFKRLDTAAKDYLFSKDIVRDKVARKAVASAMGVDLIHEGIGAEMFLGKRGMHAVNKIGNKLLKHVDIEKGAIQLYKKLIGQGKGRSEAIHSAAGVYGMNDHEFYDVLVQSGAIVESIGEIVNEDHFPKGSFVKDKGGKFWKITGSKGSGDNEIYFLQCPSGKNKSSSKAKDLTAAKREEVKESLGFTLTESPHYYGDQYDSFETDANKPVNVSDGNMNDEQVYDDMHRKPESPHQLREPGDLSPQDNSAYDVDMEVPVPKSIIDELRDEAEHARDEAERLDIRDRSSADFYRDLARAFDDLRTHLEGGTLYDIKNAQIFVQTLMGPILHKLPDSVWKWLANGGERRSLKDYMSDVGNENKLTKGFDPNIREGYKSSTFSSEELTKQLDRAKIDLARAKKNGDDDRVRQLSKIIKVLNQDLNDME